MDESVFLRRAIKLSRGYEKRAELTPFGAVVVCEGQIVGEGVSSVVVSRDPTAHAEIQAIRQACRNLDSHLLPGARLYCSGYPCPLCLMACYWSQVEEVIYAAELSDSALAGFEDTDFYHEFTLPAEERKIPVRGIGGDLRASAAEAIAEWSKRFTG